MYVSWFEKDDSEDSDFEEDHRERLIRCRGEMYDPEEVVEDAYYGTIHYGWKCVNENINDIQVETLKSVGITVVDAIKGLKESEDALFVVVQKTSDIGILPVRCFF